MNRIQDLRNGKLKVFGFESIDSQAVSYKERADAIAGYGFNPFEYENYVAFSRRLKAIRAVTGQMPLLYFHPSLSVNRNLFTETETLSTQVVTLPIGTFTFWFLAGSGNIASTNGTGVATGHGSALAGFGNKVTITVTTAGTFNFTVTGTVQKAQLSVGSDAFGYQKRTGTTASRVLNIGGLNATGDASFVNGNANTMITEDGLLFTSSSSQGITPDYTGDQRAFAMICAYKPTANQGVLMIRSTVRDRIVIDTSPVSRLRFNAESGQVASADGTVTAGVWQTLALNVDNLDVRLIRDGATLTTGTVTTRSIDNANTWKISSVSFLNGTMGEWMVFANTLTPVQHQSVHNIIKGDYGIS